MKSTFALTLSLLLFATCSTEAKDSSKITTPETTLTSTEETPSSEIIKEVEEVTPVKEITVEDIKKPEEVIPVKEEAIPVKEEVVTQPVTKIEKVEKVLEVKEEVVPDPPKVVEEIHSTWDGLTRKHISSSGKVNYSGFVKDKALLNKYIKELQSYYKDLKSWGRNKRLAYWINVYNATTVKLIVDNYPIKTITSLKGGKPWDAKLIDLGGKMYTLNDIENKIIRPRFKEPRIHFAVNCAAKSCPKIMNKAWTENNISRYLTKQTKAFLANTGQNKISADKVELSKIFDWYKADFGGSNEKVIAFINKYSDTKVNSTATVTFNEYDWNLNK